MTTRCAAARRVRYVIGLSFALAMVDRSALRAQDIDDVMHAALRSSLTIQADDARQAAAGAARRATIDAFMPTVSWVQETILDSKIKYSPDLALLSDGLDTTPRQEPNTHGIQLSLPLFDGFKRLNTYRAQDSLYGAGRYLQVDVRQQTLLDAADAYLAVARDRQIVDLRRSTLKDLSAIEQKTRIRYSVRDATITDVSLALSRVSEARTELDQSLSELTTSTIEFTRLSGSEPGGLDHPRVPNDVVPSTPQQLQDCFLRQNPKLQAAELEATAAHYTALAARAEVLPQLNLAAQHVEEDDVSAATKHLRDSTVKLQLRVPIYEPGAFPRIGEASAQATQKYYEFLDSRNQAAANAKALFFERQSTISQIANAAQRIAAMQQAVNGYNVELAAGYRTIVDTLNARSELAQARIALINLQFSRDKLTFTLAAALGRLGPAPAVPGRTVATATAGR